MSYEAQLWIGVVAFVLWNATLIVWFRSPRRRLGMAATIAAVLAFEVALIILPAGSLRLLDALTDSTWFLIGTVGRLVVACSGLVALVAVAERR